MHYRGPSAIVTSDSNAGMMGEQSCHVVGRVLRGPCILKRDIILVRERLRVPRALVTRKYSAHMMLCYRQEDAERFSHSQWRYNTDGEAI